MATLEHGHYHCIECGTLFEAAVTGQRDQRCPTCGHPPTGKVLAGAPRSRTAVSLEESSKHQPSAARDLHGVSQDSREIYEATLEAQSKKGHGRVKRSKRKTKKSKKIIVFIGVWLALMVATVFLVKYFSAEENETIAQLEVDQERENKRKEYELQKKRAVIEAAVPKCEQVMSKFLNASSPATKAQYVYQGVRLSGVMARYYRNNPSFSSTRSILKITWADTLEFDNKKVIGAMCQNSLGEKFEAVFINNGTEWRIDWLSLIRYDAKPWSLFQAGPDGDEGEFRLYMRVRDSNKNLEQREMSIVFYKPKMYVKNDVSYLASSPVLVAVDSPLGIKIKGMLDRAGEQKKDAHGFPVGDVDLPGYHRVRVKLRLHKKEGAPSHMELLEITANDWYGMEQAERGTGLDSVR